MPHHFRVFNFIIMERTCKKCGETKLIEEFIIDKKYKSGHGYRCKQCKNKLLSEGLFC